MQYQSTRDIVLGLEPVKRLIEACQAARFDLTSAWIVGGVVRDAILYGDQMEFAERDLDLMIDGDGETFAHGLAAAIDGEVVASHSFGTATVFAALGENGTQVRIDIASGRTEHYAQPGALPEVKLGATLEEDLARRDFNVNAMAVPIELADRRPELFDPFHGGEALLRRSVAVLHDNSFRDDPTRIMRLARYAARFGLRLQKSTREQLLSAVSDGALRTISADRLRQELVLILQERAWEALTLLASWGVLAELEPRIEQAFHTPLVLPVIDAACGNNAELHKHSWPLRLAALIRGLGDDVEGWMRWIGFSASEINAVSGHVFVLNIMLEAVEAPAKFLALKNSDLYLKLGEVDDDSFALAALVAMNETEIIDRLTKYREAIRDTRLTIRGDDVMAAGVPAGREVGELLGQIFLKSLDGEIVGEAAEREAIARYVEGHE